MNHHLKIGLIAGLITIVAVGVIEVALAKTENDFFQFCTTKAYGWPAPWKIEYCECEGLKTTYPKISMIVNLSSIAGSGVVGFFIVGGISRLRQRKG